MKRYLLLLAFSLVLTAAKTFAQYIEFTENKGQWDPRVKYRGRMNGGAFFLQPQGYKVVLHDMNDLKKIADYYGGHIAKPDSAGAKSLQKPGQKFTVRSHAYEVTFEGASKDAAVEADKPLDSYDNYFVGSDKSKWASHCRIFRAVTYKNLYPNVDARYYTDNGSLKYDLIINPGADINKIALRFDGVDALSVKNGNLVVKTSVGEVSELEPYSYQPTGKGRQKVSAKFVVSGNTVRFKVGNYSKNSTLIIDPTLIFSTFIGSQADNWGYTATYDGAGNFYAGGIAFAEGYRYNQFNGAYQTQYGGGDGSEGVAGGYDVAISKFDPFGTTRLYATYLGGDGDEQPHSLVVDGNGDLIIAGRTTSDSFPVTQSPFGPCGGFDIFIAKLSSDGLQLLSSRKFGGTGSDGVNVAPKYQSGGASATRRNYGDDGRSEVITDGSNIYLASCTQSADFPVTGNAFQKTRGGSGEDQDGVFIKTTNDLSTVLASSFLGGNKIDAAFVLAINPSNNNVYIAGGTVSTNLKGTSGGNDLILFNTYQGGQCDGFVSIISNDGSTLIRTRYVGTNGNDLIYGIQFDKFGVPYIMGTTSVAFPVRNAVWSQTNGKQFISKLQPDLSAVLYTTNFGKSTGSAPDISPTAFLVDRCENVYVSGWGGGLDSGDGYPNAGTYGLSYTTRAIDSTTDGSDFYFFVLKKGASGQLYGSFFGADGSSTPNVLGDHVDGGTSRFDKEGVIYQAICANCGLVGRFPTGPTGVWSLNNPAQTGAFCNEAAVKIAFELAGVGAGIKSFIHGVPRDTAGCVPLTVDFTDTLGLGQTYIWDFGDGSPRDTTLQDSTITHTFNNIGNYRVMLIAIDSNTCNIADTSYTNIRVRADSAFVGFVWRKLPPCDSLKYEFTNISQAPPNKPFNNQSFTWDFGDGTIIVTDAPVITHNYIAPGTYNITLKLTDTSYCNAPDSAVQQIRIAINVTAQFETPPFGCAPYDAVFTNTSVGGLQFLWDFGDGTTSTDVSPVHQYPNPGNYTINLIAFDSTTCNKIDSASFDIVVSPKPIAGFSVTPQPPKENTELTFINRSTGGTRFKWFFGDGDSLITTKVDTPVTHIYNRTDTYYACLVAYNNYGCTDTICDSVAAIVIPLVDVANAFTPNGDGINDVVRVRGYGIDKMMWRIYNRWGAMVFQGSSLKDGWNGFYKGSLQPQEVYMYILDVSFTDGTKYQKKGDITLLR